MFLAEFAKKKEKENKPTLRQRIIGTTSAGKAFRAGTLISGAGLVGLGLKNKKQVKKLFKDPKNVFTRDVNDLPKTVKTTMTHSKVKNKGDKVYTSDRGSVKVVTDPNKVNTRKPGTFLDDDWQEKTDLYDSTVRETYSKDKERGFLGSNRKAKWGNIAKVGGIGAGALAVPTSMAYIAGSKKDKEDIEKRLSGGANKLTKGVEATRRMVNTLHRVSR